MQLELRQAADTVAAKNEELLHLNRGNGRVLEQKTTLDREQADLRTQLRRAEQLLATQQPLVLAQPELERRVATLLARQATAEDETARLTTALEHERVSRREAELARDRLDERVRTLDDVLAQLNVRPRKGTTPKATQPLPDLLAGDSPRSSSAE